MGAKNFSIFYEMDTRRRPWRRKIEENNGTYKDRILIKFTRIII
jgi:hypothetical protein